MSASRTPTPIVQVHRRAPRVDTGAVKPAVAVPEHADKTSGRHAVITENLNTWSSYKSWVQRIRGTWEEKK